MVGVDAGRRGMLALPRHARGYSGLLSLPELLNLEYSPEHAESKDDDCEDDVYCVHDDLHERGLAPPRVNDSSELLLCDRTSRTPYRTRLASDTDTTKPMLMT